MVNAFCRAVGIEVPVVLAPMGGAGGPDLAAAVSEAGGLGMMPVWWMTDAEIADAMAAVRARTDKPFGVNLNNKDPQAERLEAVVREGAKVVSLFWGIEPGLIARAREAGLYVLQTVSSAREAEAAVGAGASAVVTQGWEAGGHVRGSVATISLVPAVADAVDVPVIAAGGIADGRGLAAALCLGASAAWIGTRFIASPEATVHPSYRARLIAAREDDTWYGTEVFDGGWPGAPHRVLRTKTVVDWERAGRPPAGRRPGEGEIVATDPGPMDLPRYIINLPSSGTTGDVEALAHYAGQGVGLVRREQPAGDILREIWQEARERLADLAPALA